MDEINEDSSSKPEPEVKKRGGAKSKPALRWSLNQAGYEFHTDSVTLEKRRRTLGIEPGLDLMYSSMDIAKMIFGDKEAETIGKLAAERRQIELKNAVTEGKLIEMDVVLRWAARVVVPIRQCILSSRLPDEDKTYILEQLVKMGETDFGDAGTPDT